VAFDLLLSPVRVGRREVRNRVVVTAHGATELFRSPALPAGPYVEYLRRRAAGGVGLIIAQPQFPDPGANFSAETVRRHRQLADAVHGEGALLLLQLAHLGLYGRSESDPRRPPLWSFDNGQSEAGEAGHRMTAHEVERMVDAYRRAAVLAAEAGFDGVEVHGAHGYLIQQALTPRWNHRDDEWGADRTLFARRIIAAARDALGPDGIVGYRTATDDLRSPEDGGRGPAGIADDLRAILGTGQVDLLNTTVGDGGASYARAIPSYRYGEAPNVPFIVRLRELVDITVPVVGVGRIASPAAAEAVLAAGTCDLVAMTRAHIADPDLVAKTAAGAGDRIRPCVGANVCVDRKLAGFADISCFHNPTVLRETELAITPASVRRRILIVGAGPAGLKAAETAALRGHEVLLFDELRHTDATIRLGTAVDERVLREVGPDEVLLATGSRALTPAEAIEGGASGRVLSTTEALATDVSGDVLVWDSIGTNEAALVAETLARRGCRVTFATRFETVAPYGGQLHRWVVPDILRQRMDQIYADAVLGYLDGDVALLVRADGSTVADVKAPTVVAAVAGRPRTELVAALERLGRPYRLLGDAQAPRSAWSAFTDGLTAALAV
jgi:2,4-dienoyl-CoA reductase-like NADH-dependent reductase (Old Yellow Enzyme family)